MEKLSSYAFFRAESELEIGHVRQAAARHYIF